MPAEWIKKLNESNSRTHKETTIQQAIASSKLGDQSADLFLKGAYNAYNPFLTYGIKKVPDSEGIFNALNPWPTFFSLLTDLAKRELTGNNAINAIEATSTLFDSDQWNLFCKPVILKDLRVGATIKTFNKYLKGHKYEIPVFECQLATDSAKHEKKLVGEKFIQRKLDGVRALVVVRDAGPQYIVEIFSRNGKPFQNFGHIIDQVGEIAAKISNITGYPEFVLDGEVMSDDFQALMKQAHRKYDAQAEDSVYHIFDVINLNSFAKGISKIRQDVRTNTLEGMKFINNQPNLHIEDHLRVNLNTAEGHDQMRRYANDAVAHGFEGIMIKDAAGPYECKRATHWLKWKPVITVDLTVVDVEEGTGRNEGRLGALVCEGVDDGRKIRVNVGSGLSDDNRDDYWRARSDILGQVVEVKADAVTQNQDGTYSLRFPRFERFRGFETGEKL